MMGTLGIGCNILKFSEEETAISKKMISLYKEIRHIVQKGNFYRLENTSDNKYFLYEYLKDNKGLLFAFLPQSKIGHRKTTVKLRGLDENAVYVVQTDLGEITKKGGYLMNCGLEIGLSGDYASTVIRFEKKAE